MPVAALRKEHAGASRCLVQGLVGPHGEVPGKAQVAAVQAQLGVQRKATWGARVRLALSAECLRVSRIGWLSKLAGRVNGLEPKRGHLPIIHGWASHVHRLWG